MKANMIAALLLLALAVIGAVMIAAMVARSFQGVQLP